MPVDPAVEDRLRPPSPDQLRVRAAEIRHPLLSPVKLDSTDGLTPDQAAVVAVLINPNLRAIRNQRGTARAALLQAGLLPNPTVTASSDFITGGFRDGTFNAYGATFSWDVTSLISHSAKVQAAIDTEKSVDLSVAWQEWQTAEAAKIAVYDLISLQKQLTVLEEIDGRLKENADLIRRAQEQGFKTVVDLAAAETSSQDTHALLLQARHDVDHQWLQLTRAIGFPPDARPKLQSGLLLASHFEIPADVDLTTGLDKRRIDLIALRHGYDSEEQTLRAAILDQFPKINFGFNYASDNSNVHSVGLVATIDLPIFDRNQGVIAAEKATRQRLFDDYAGRLFDARADAATAVSDINALNGQIADAEAAVPNLKKLVGVYKQATDHGNADVLSYYTAWNNLAQKKLSVLKLQQQLADTRVGLELATGRYYPDPAVAVSTTRPTTLPADTTPPPQTNPETRP